tara:strand:- start:244 stop:1725 length:1482 start_codon:yes stop_codon:yes gene_type:complete
MAVNVKYVRSEAAFIVTDGLLIEDEVSLGANVTAKLNRTNGNFEALNLDETYNSLDSIGWHVNDQGYRWWSDPNNQVFGTENEGGSSPWRIYKQSNIYTTARKYAGKDNLYGLHLFRYPNISSSSTWGGLALYPPALSKLSGHKYRFSFDYRGNTGGANLDVYQNYEIGWGNMGVNLPTPWGKSISSFDTDWEWRRYEHEFEISDEYLNWIPGQNSQVWNSTTSYPSGYYGITYNGYVYRKYPGVATTVGLTPEQEYQNGGVYNGKYPMTPGYFDLYRQIKIGFTYNTQGTRGTHVYVDNIQMTDITSNQSFKYNGTTWEANQLEEKTIHVFAKGTGAVTIDKGDGGDRFACEGNRVLIINDTQIYNTSGRGLRLTVIDEDTLEIVRDEDFDTYGVDSRRTDLANALSEISDTHIWTLTSFDAIGINSALESQMERMKSVLHRDNGSIYSVFTGGGVRHPYAAVGRGQKVIKEDGANANDSVYKRKGVIDLKV